ncbi:7032_t:CDS:2 [Paraglomus occultum]|uniref:7032_t:CDS:1 n=1 Tax=Paraglomus occultum TaxID=144539 RepID=A0A9N9CXN7_9GLOM|nr:7032_t:CDS:2 [Paraglomus occultum]
MLETQKAPEHSGSSKSGTPNLHIENEIYQGPTSLHDDVTSMYEEFNLDGQSHPPSPHSEYVSMEPEYSNTNTQITNETHSDNQITKKRHIEISSSGSPQPTNLGNIYNYFSKQPRNNTADPEN